jgi:anti-sigma regulatory factor (Ser/Thr protein kinase)
MSVMTVEAVRQCRMALPGICPDEIGPVREIVRAHLRLWRKTSLSGLAELGVSELLTNVCKHASGDCELLVREMPDGILVAVTDFDDRLPIVKEPTGDQESGRGLFLLMSVVDQMAVEPLLYGKQVWFRLKQEGTPRC